MTKNRVPRWMAIAVPLVFLGGAVFCVVFYSPWILRQEIPTASHSLPESVVCPTSTSFDGFESRFIGHKDDAIAAQFGPPTERINGHYGNPPVSVQRMYPEAFTYVYTSSTGSLYLSFCQQRGRWVCFRASWLPEGSAF